MTDLLQETVGTAPVYYSGKDLAHPAEGEPSKEVTSEHARQSSNQQKLKNLFILGNNSRGGGVVLSNELSKDIISL